MTPQIVRKVTLFLALAASLTAQTGDAVPALAGLDRGVQALMTKYKIPGAALAVSRGGKLIYARGFGQANRELAIPVQPDSLFRIGSISKPITVAAALKLVQDRKLDLDARIVPLLGRDLVAPERLADTRWNDITVRHLMQHTAGWDADTTFDPLLSYRVIEDLGLQLPLPRPITTDDVIRLMVKQPLQTAPGSTYSYSNFGMMLLGRVIEKVSGMAYEKFVKQSVLEPMGIQRMAISGSLPSQRRLGEVDYYDPTVLPALYPGIGETVPAPDGGYDFSVIQGAGAWMASPIDLVRFADGLDGRTPPALLNPDLVKAITTRPSYDKSTDAFYGLGWFILPLPGSLDWLHDGAIEGTYALLYRSSVTGITFALTCNAFPQDENLFDDILDAVSGPLLAVNQWPTTDSYAQLLPATEPYIAGVVDGASQRPVASPGALVTLYGLNLGPQVGLGASLDAAGRLTTTLGGVQVLFDGVPAPLLYVDRNQINALVPQAVAGKATTSVVVVQNGRRSAARTAALAATLPALFTLSGNGRGILAALNADGRINGENTPAARGNALTVWGTGFGALQTQLSDGSVASAINRLRETPRFTLDGQPVEVLYAGAAPGIVAGAVQVNLRLPAQVRPGRVFLEAVLPGSTSRTGVWVWVR